MEITINVCIFLLCLMLAAIVIGTIIAMAFILHEMIHESRKRK